VTPSSGLNTNEFASTDTFDVILDRQPATGTIVTVPLSSSNTDEGTVSPGNLIFDEFNWNVAQTVTLTGVDDNVDDGDIGYHVVTGAFTSTDSIYDGLNPPQVVTDGQTLDVNLVPDQGFVIHSTAGSCGGSLAGDLYTTNSVTADCDITAEFKGILITPKSVVTSEWGASAQFDVVLTHEPTSGSVSFALSSSDETEGTIDTSNISFDGTNWSNPVTVTVTGIDDLVDDGDVRFSIVTGTVSAADIDYNGLDPHDVIVTNLDNEGVSIAAGFDHSIVQRIDNEIWAWGDNNNGQLGDSSKTRELLPFKLDNSMEITLISASRYHSLALSSDGTVHGWGNNSYGQLGNNSTSAAFQPVQSSGLTDVVDIATGYYSSYALQTDGSLWSWGYNGYGELGNGNTGGNYLIPNDTGFSGFADIKAGQYFAAGLKTNGTVWTWGYQSNGRLGNGSFANSSQSTPVMISGLTDVVAIAVNYQHGLALKADGTVWAWGYNYYGQLGDGSNTNSAIPVQVSGLTDAIAIAAGEVHSLAIKSDGTVWSWGWNSNYQLGDGTSNPSNVPVQVAGISNASQIVAGRYHSLVLLEDGKIFSFGINTTGQLGDGTTNTTGNAVQVLGDLNLYYGITVSPVSGLVTTEAGGADTFTVVLDYPPAADVTIPLQSSDTSEGSVTPSSLTFTTSNWSTTQTVTVTGVDDSFHDEDIAYDIQLLPASSADSNYNGIDGDDVTANNINDDAGILVSDTSLVTTEWGATATFEVKLDTIEPTADVIVDLSSSDIGEVMVSPTTLTFNPGVGWDIPQTVTVTGVNDDQDDGNSFVTIVTANAISADSDYDNLSSDDVTVVNLDDDGTMVDNDQEHSAALKTDGTVWTWGRNNYGQLGDGTTTQRNLPVQVSDLSDVIAIETVNNYGLAVKSDGTVWSWGRNNYGQLGDGTTTQRNSPVQVNDLTNIVSVAGDASSSLALRSDGTVWAWGRNNYRQLGDNTTTSRQSPVQVIGLTDVVAIAMDYHGMALKSDGSVWTWGRNNNGQLGHGGTSTQGLAAKAHDLDDVIGISGSYLTTQVLRLDKTVWGWGDNAAGKLGDGTTTDRLTPVQALNLTDVAAISSDADHTLALKTDGTIWSWGENAQGRLGDGTTSDRYTPVQVDNLSNVVVVAGGYNSSFAITSDGSVWGWGNGSYGDIGDGDTGDHSSPVLVGNGFNVLYGLTVSPDTGLVTSEDGGTDTFTVVLDNQPTAGG